MYKKVGARHPGVTEVCVSGLPSRPQKLAPRITVAPEFVKLSWSAGALPRCYFLQATTGPSDIESTWREIARRRLCGIDGPWNCSRDERSFSCGPRTSRSRSKPRRAAWAAPGVHNVDDRIAVVP